MTSFAIDLDSLLTVAAGVLDERGVLLEANAGFLRLLPVSSTPPIGARAARYFIQPTFTALLAAVEDGDADGYHGLITIGDYAGKVRTLRGRVWRSASEIRVLAEYDIAELEQLTDAVLDLNRESTVAQYALAGANAGLKQREVRIIETSLTDALTGVGNRHRLDQALAIEISRAQRGSSVLSAVMVDIDHFKQINDEYGHSAGDKVLAAFGAMLRSQTRQTDIPTRFGGEEFVVLMPHVTLAQATAKAELLRVAISAEPFAPLSKATTASFGVAELAPGEDAESFLCRMDKALYQAKTSGRNRVVALSLAPGGSP